jgi:hypothetical protein
MPIMKAATSDKAAVRDMSGSFSIDEITVSSGCEAPHRGQRSYGGLGGQGSVRPPRLLHAAR